MNLCVREKTDNSLSRVLPLAIILAILVAVFCKFAVIDRLTALSEARSKYETAARELNEAKAQVADFKEVQEQYVRYTSNFKSDEEKALADRKAALDLIQNAAKDLAEVKTVNIIGNTAVLQIRTGTLEDVRTLCTRLEANEGVISITVNRADKSETTENGYTHRVVNAAMQVTFADGMTATGEVAK